MTTHLLSFIYSGLAVDREIVRHLSPVMAYVPWGVNPPEYLNGSEIIVSYPPEELRPTVDINTMLDECYNWAYERGERSRNEIIKTSSGPVSDETLSSIRNILSGKTVTDASEKDMTNRCHLLLYLADRFERQRKEANRMIETIRKRRSPLFNHADLTDKTIYPFDTLKEMDTESFVRDSNMGQLLKAWHSLFGGYIGDGDLILTIDQPVFDYILNECERLFHDNDLKTPLAFSFKAPIFYEKEKDDARDDIKTIFSEIRNEEWPSGVMYLLKEYESMYCTGPNDSHTLFTVLYIDTDTAKNDPILRLFSGRIILHGKIFVPKTLL